MQGSAGRKRLETERLMNIAEDLQTRLSSSPQKNFFLSALDKK